MDILKEIYEDAHTYELKSSDSSVGRNLSLIITWLEATFPELADPQMEGDDVLVLSARPHALLDASLALQGPLVHASHGREKNGTDVSSSYCEGKPIVVKNLSGPRAIIIPPSTSLRSLNPDSIEGRSTLHHHIKLFHENYVEYAHKVYIELEQHDRISDQELDALKSSMEALDARRKRYVSSSPDGSSITARQAPGRRKDYLTDSQVSKLKSSLDLLSSFNIENTRKVRLIEDRLSRQHK
ncbi:hypothetical protein HPP92_019395 [Vanilla planifolia]|uniref:Uncharacterized protein n=1 Tax=Vanilla planifolia TaxID=51239 RepID=A0A835Q2T0_VANPL|nr:hypothetical protein HPP92_019395 [Vanilla planifolia]